MFAKALSKGFLKAPLKDYKDIESDSDSVGESVDSNKAIDEEFHPVREIKVNNRSQSAAERAIQSGKRKHVECISEPLFIADAESDTSDNEVSLSQNTSLLHSQNTPEDDCFTKHDEDDTSAQMNITQYKLQNKKQSANLSPLRTSSRRKTILRRNQNVQISDDDSNDDAFIDNPKRPNHADTYLKPLNQSTHVPKIRKVSLEHTHSKSKEFTTEPITLNMNQLNGGKSVFDAEDQTDKQLWKAKLQTKNAVITPPSEDINSKQALDKRMKEILEKEILEKRAKEINAHKYPLEAQKEQRELIVKSRLTFNLKRKQEIDSFRKSLAHQDSKALLNKKAPDDKVKSIEVNLVADESAFQSKKKPAFEIKTVKSSNETKAPRSKRAVKSKFPFIAEDNLKALEQELRDIRNQKAELFGRIEKLNSLENRITKAVLKFKADDTNKAKKKRIELVAKESNDIIVLQSDESDQEQEPEEVANFTETQKTVDEHIGILEQLVLKADAVKKENTTASQEEKLVYEPTAAKSDKKIKKVGLKRAQMKLKRKKITTEPKRIKKPRRKETTVIVLSDDSVGFENSDFSDSGERTACMRCQRNKRSCDNVFPTCDQCRCLKVKCI